MSESFFVDGVKYVLLEDYNKALERLLKAYALNPANAAINYKIAETNLLSGNLKDATNFAQAAVKLCPQKRLLLPAAGPDLCFAEAVRSRPPRSIPA